VRTSPSGRRQSRPEKRWPSTLPLVRTASRLPSRKGFHERMLRPPDRKGTAAERVGLGLTNHVGAAASRAPPRSRHARQISRVTQPVLRQSYARGSGWCTRPSDHVAEVEAGWEAGAVGDRSPGRVGDPVRMPGLVPVGQVNSRRAFPLPMGLRRGDHRASDPAASWLVVASTPGSHL